MRADLYLYNEATAWVVAAEDLAGHAPGKLTSSEEAWEKGMREGAFLPIHLVQDDSQIIRVVIDEPLHPQEEEEWVGVVESALNLRCGRVVLAAGTPYLDDPDDEWLSENHAIHTFDLPPGKYRVRIYTHLPGTNGDYGLGLEEGELTKYWKSTRPGEPIPTWISYFDDDMFEEEEGDESPPCIGFLVHLERFDGPISMPKLDEGYPEIDAGKRRPTLCPRGITAGPEILGYTDREEGDSEPIEPYPAGELASTLRMEPLEGGPVSVPCRDMRWPFCLAWMCSDGATPEIRVRYPGAIPPIDFPTPPNVAIEEGESFRQFGFGESGMKWAHWNDIKQLCLSLGSTPDESRIELDVVCPDDEDDEPTPGPGWHRYSGMVKDGLWHIDSAYPRIDAATLRRAFELIGQAADREPYTVGEQEAAEVLERAKKDFLLRESKITYSNGILSVEDPDLHVFLGIKIFAVRFDDVWEMEDEDDEVEVWDQAMNALTAAFAAPTTGEVVLEGQSGTFKVGDLGSFKIAATLIPEIDGEMRSLGFVRFADLVHSRFGDVIMRAYIGTCGDRYGIIYLGMFGQMGVDFYSLFGDGTSLTTSTITKQADEPEKGIYRTPTEATQYAEINKLHSERLVTMRQEHGGTVPTLGAAKALAAMIDEFIVRSGA